jgi:hypothetical protein
VNDEEKKEALAKYGCEIPEIDDASCKGEHLILTRSSGNYLNDDFKVGLVNFSINSDYCFFWNVSDAWYVSIDFYDKPIEEQSSESYFKAIKLHVDKNDRVT